MIRFCSSQEICATWGAIVIRICDGCRTEEEDLIRVDALFNELLEERAAIGMLLVYTHGTPLPSTTAQRYVMRSMSRYGDKLAISVAALGLGFWASTLRTSINALVRVIRGNVAMEGTVETAATRLSMELIGIDPDALLNAYQGLWSELERTRLAS